MTILADSTPSRPWKKKIQLQELQFKINFILSSKLDRLEKDEQLLHKFILIS